MITTILEVLVAVVVLIVIIAVAALHFLRADDSDTFDDMPEEPRRTRRQPEPEAAPVSVGAGRGSAARGGRAADDRGQAWDDRDNRNRDGRDRDSKARPSKPARKGGPATSGKRPVPVAAAQGTARQANGARQPDADSGASEWDKLSDVDYWAELAADKPLTPTAAAPSESPRPPRRGADQKNDPRTAPRAEVAQLPVRQRSQSRPAPAPAGRLADPSQTAQTEQIDVRAARSSGRYGTDPGANGVAALARLADQPPVSSQQPELRSPGGQRLPGGQRPVNGRPASGQRPIAAADRRLPGTGPRPAQRALPPAPAAQHSGGHARPPLPMDDDPLTSPSFPAINTSDSRSYRTGRPSGSPSSGAPRNGGNGMGAHSAGSYSQPAQPYSAYPATPDRSASVPNGYPVQPAAASAAGSSYAAGPVANPYGSYVKAPQPGYSEPATQATPAAPHLDPAAYGSGYAAGQQAVAGANWYASTLDASQVANGYLPAPGNGLSYENPAYQNGHASQNGHSAQPGGYAPGYLSSQYDQPGYGAPELTYGQDGYPGYPGYGGSGR